MKKQSKKTKNDLSRRNFIKKAALGVGVTAMAGLDINAEECQSALPVEKWDREADVVVVGTGFAGMSAAITAHDAGAQVLILEKAPKKYEGGNSKVSGNMWWAPTDVEEAVKYITALCYGLTDAESIRTLAQGMFENNAWLKSFGIDIEPLGMFQPEYPELPGGETVRTYNSAQGSFKGALYIPLRKLVTDRNIPVMYETPAMELVQNVNREVIGLKAKSNGKVITIKARRGIVLACGGFEFAHDLQQQYLPGWPMYGQGTTYNTGDGIKMAQQAGAGLWHMNNALAGIGAMLIDDPELGRLPVAPALFRSPYIVTDQQGKRFINENSRSRHGLGHKEHLIFFDVMNTQSFPRIPCYAIFDATTLQRRLVFSGRGGGWFGTHTSYKWSADNSVEIEKGWVFKGETLSELATKLNIKPDVLENTITTYNQYCEKGVDPEFGRPKRGLKKIEKAPYGAVKLYPFMFNTQGGPQRNARCQIVDPFGNPIPRLYSAGELGSFWGWMYNGGGNNAECMVTGRIAGANAAALPSWVSVL